MPLNTISNYGKHFIAIKVQDADAVLKKLKKKLAIKVKECKKNEIILSIPDEGYDFSYAELKNVLREITEGIDDHVMIGTFILYADTYVKPVKFTREYTNKLKAL